MSRPKPALSIPLMAVKIPTLVGHLDYRRLELSKKQKRFAERYALIPDIDLNSFKTRAVIDWIRIAVLLEKTTQFQWIQRAIEPVIGRVPHIDNWSKDKNASSERFSITFQEPDIAKLYEAMAALEVKFGLAMDPVVHGIEVSVDFTPRTPSDLDRAKMTRVLCNHLLVRRDVMSDLRDRPRTVWGEGAGKTTRLLYDSARLTKTESNEFLISPDRDRAPFTDGTLEVGAREADVRWRVMDKVKDRQNRRTGTFLALDDKSKRARIEVTLDRPEMEALGVTYLDDLKTLNFTELQGRYFRFFLPTFSQRAELLSGARSAMEVWRDRQRSIKFTKTGVIGLKTMDDGLAEQKKGTQRAALPDLHRRGLRVPRIERVSIGEAGSFVAYEEMNKRVLTTLRNLGKRVADDFPPSFSRN